MGSDDSDTCRVTKRNQAKRKGEEYCSYGNRSVSLCQNFRRQEHSLLFLILFHAEPITHSSWSCQTCTQYQPTHHGIEPWMSCCSCVSIIIWRGTMILFYALLTLNDECHSSPSSRQVQWYDVVIHFRRITLRLSCRQQGAPPISACV